MPAHHRETEFQAHTEHQVLNTSGDLKHLKYVVLAQGVLWAGTTLFTAISLLPASIGAAATRTSTRAEPPGHTRNDHWRAGAGKLASPVREETDGKDPAT